MLVKINKISYMFVIIILSSIFIIGCASHSLGLMSRNISDAHNLREHSQLLGIESTEITSADSLLKTALASKEIEKFEDANWQADLAIGFYKIGILKYELDNSENTVEKLKNALMADKEHLTSLIDVYDEIKTLRKQ